MAASVAPGFDAVAATAPAPFPARTTQVAGRVDGTRTEVTLTQFADKILMTITQEGRLAHWVSRWHCLHIAPSPELTVRRQVHVPLANPDPHAADPLAAPSTSDDGSHLLPMPHLTATTILGASAGERETAGQLVATQIASAISAKRPSEKRLLVVGLGLKKAEMERDTFMQLLELALSTLP